ncbi:hypothetical protein VSR68_03505 [Paraburkholderia phymatum]|uniref:hypothetical protein n=1 Tax=Paraburkholderia phymatum TaxID=148447 RepID=UPI00316E80C8
MPTSEIARLQGFKFYLAIFTVLPGTFMNNLDAAIANIAIPVIATSVVEGLGGGRFFGGIV